MTSLHAIFQRAAFALALVGAGIAGPQLLPTVTTDETAGLCLLARQAATTATKPAITLNRRPRVVVVARD